MVDHREAILAFMKEKGPILPAALAKHLKMDLLFSSAHLAEMTETGKLKSSWLKIGGSPLYYIPGQEELLENFWENLGEKDKRAFQLLKQEKLVRENDLDPLSRVAIKGMKDFSIPVIVTQDGIQEQYWKFHSVSNDEVQHILKSRFEPASEKKTEGKSPIEKLEKPRQKTESKIEQKKESKKEEQKPLVAEEIAKEASKEKQQHQKKEKKEKPKISDTFALDVLTFFEKNNIAIREHTILKKDTEIDYIIQIPSIVGNLEYYCKAKNKKKISDSDISGAYVAGQMKKLPVILLIAGEPSKKAMEVLSSLKSIVLYRLE